MQSIFLVNDWRNSFLTINTLTSDWHTLTYLESGNEYFFFQKTFTWSEYLNSIMIFDGKLHEMITITFLKKNDPAEWKISVKNSWISWSNKLSRCYYHNCTTNWKRFLSQVLWEEHFQRRNKHSLCNCMTGL